MAESGQGDPESARMCNLARVRRIVSKETWLQKTGPGVVTRVPGKVMDVVPERLDERLKQMEIAFLFSQPPPLHPQLSWSSSHLAWISFSLFFFLIA